MAPRTTVTAPRARVPALLLLAAMGLFAAASCGDVGPPVALGLCQPVDPAVGFSARDSGGVRVVENLSPARGLSLQLADEPSAVIGARDDDPDDVIGRLAGAVLLPDDRIVVADGLAMELRVHAPDGTFLRRLGGPGDGPEEFSRSLDLHRGPGDTLVVAHEFGLRYRRVLPDGTFLDGGYVTAAPGQGATSHSLYGVFGDGAFLAMERRSASSSEPATEVRRLDHRVQRLDAATGAMGPVLTLPRQDYFTYLHEEGEFEGSITFGDLPFGRVESWALGASEIYVGRGNAFQVERWAPHGEVTGLFRICEEPESVDPEELQRAIDRIAEGYDEPMATMERVAMGGVPHPTMEPAHLEMLVDGAGRLWVRAFAPDWEEQSWRIFDATGRWIGSVRTPAGLRVLDAGADRLLTAARNELSVETVQVLALRQAP